jgi:hypothetical protein
MSSSVMALPSRMGPQEGGSRTLSVGEKIWDKVRLGADMSLRAEGESIWSEGSGDVRGRSERIEPRRRTMVVVAVLVWTGVLLAAAAAAAVGVEEARR